MDTRHPRELAATGHKPVVAGLVINGLLAGAKVTAGVWGNSFALIADGIESLSDVFSSMIVYTGLRYSAKPRDANHPYGHGKAEPLAAAFVGLALVGAGLSIAVQSIREILRPHTLPAPYTLVVLAAVVLIKETMFRYSHGIGTGIESLSVKADAWHHRSDAITSALAFVGIAVALWRGPGYEAADDWAALLASGIILFNAYHQIHPALHDLSDAAPPPSVAEAVHSIARTVPGVRDTEKCFVRKMGFEYFVDLHVLVDAELTVRRGHGIAHDVKDAILEKYPRITEVLVHIEPYDGAPAP